MKLFPIRRIRRVLLILGILLGLGGFLTWATYRARLFYSSVCSQCGAHQRTVEWNIPFTDIVMHKRSVERSSPLSRTLSEHGLVAPHSHQWLLTLGEGNGYACLLGEEGREIVGATYSERLCDIIESLQAKGEGAFLAQIQKDIFNYKTSQTVQKWVQTLPKTPTSEVEFPNWLREQRQRLDAMLAKEAEDREALRKQLDH